MSRLKDKLKIGPEPPTMVFQQRSQLCLKPFTLVDAKCSTNLLSPNYYFLFFCVTVDGKLSFH